MKNDRIPEEFGRLRERPRTRTRRFECGVQLKVARSVALGTDADVTTDTDHEEASPVGDGIDVIASGSERLVAARDPCEEAACEHAFSAEIRTNRETTDATAGNRFDTEDVTTRFVSAVQTMTAHAPGAVDLVAPFDAELPGQARLHVIVSSRVPRGSTGAGRVELEVRSIDTQVASEEEPKRIAASRMVGFPALRSVPPR